MNSTVNTAKLYFNQSRSCLIFYCRKYSINVFFLRYRFIFKPMLCHNSFVDYIWNAAFSQPCFFSACPDVMPAQNPRIFHQQVVKVNTTEQHNSRREWEKKKAFCSFLLIHTHGALQHKTHTQFLIIHNFPLVHHHPVSLRLLRPCVCALQCVCLIHQESCDSWEN